MKILVFHHFVLCTLGGTRKERIMVSPARLARMCGLPNLVHMHVMQVIAPT